MMIMARQSESDSVLHAGSSTNVHSSYWVELLGVRAERSVLKWSKTRGHKGTCVGEGVSP